MSSGGCGVNPHSLHPSVITYVQSRVSGAMAAGTVMPTSFTCGGGGPKQAWARSEAKRDN